MNKLTIITLVALLSVPLAALHDGEHFLIEQFACAVSPGVALALGPR